MDNNLHGDVEPVYALISEALSCQLRMCRPVEVEVVFGLPGDGINGIVDGLRRHRDRMRALKRL